MPVARKHNRKANFMRVLTKVCRERFYFTESSSHHLALRFLFGLLLGKNFFEGEWNSFLHFSG